MTLINQIVLHKKYGKGIIEEFDKAGHVMVKFDRVPKLKKFQYPEAFEKFLSFEDSSLQKDVMDQIEAKEEQAVAEPAKEEAPKAEGVAGSAAETVQEKPKVMKEEEIEAARAHLMKGNMAVKCTFCDGAATAQSIGFAGVCSQENIKINIKKGRAVCMETACQKFTKGEYTYDEVLMEYKKNGSICDESRMLIDWIAYTPVHHSGKHEGEPIKFKEAKVGGLALYTTNLPGSREEDRVIFGAFIIQESFDGHHDELGYVAADLDYCIEMTPKEAEGLKFWEYYYDHHKPERIQFGSGVHRYFAKEQAIEILEEICKIKKGTKDENQAKKVLDRYTQLNR